MVSRTVFKRTAIKLERFTMHKQLAIDIRSHQHDSFFTWVFAAAVWEGDSSTSVGGIASVVQFSHHAQPKCGVLVVQISYTDSSRKWVIIWVTWFFVTASRLIAASSSWTDEGCWKGRKYLAGSRSGLTARKRLTNKNTILFYQDFLLSFIQITFPEVFIRN